MKQTNARTNHAARQSWFAAVVFSVCAWALPVAGAQSLDTRVAETFNQVSDDPVLLRVFLRDMPKGGDLHNHASGTPYAEEYLDWADARDFCVTADPARISLPPCNDPGEETAVDLEWRNPQLYEQAINSLSVKEMLEGVDNGHTGHNQFFSTFRKFDAIVRAEPGKTLASVKQLAAADNVSYVELMFNPRTVDKYFSQVVDPDWNSDDLEAAFKRFEPEIEALVQTAIREHDRTETEANQILKCGTPQEEPGCDVTVYYNMYGLRRFPNEQLFRQLVLGFAIIEADPRFLGISLVEPEDDSRAVQNYDLHMEMIAFLDKKYPTARISLHAGELTLGLAPAYALRSHIKDAIEVAGSERIGHGIDIAWELESRETLKRMAREKIAVEINLTSNDVILGIKGKDHLLNLYRASGVPIVLSTDDQGVLRTDMTEQYVRAALEHGLEYADLKEAARNSLEYSFLPGESIWEPGEVGAHSAACPSPGTRQCHDLVMTSPKAALQHKLETDFIQFEQDILGWEFQ